MLPHLLWTVGLGLGCQSTVTDPPAPPSEPIPDVDRQGPPLPFEPPRAVTTVTAPDLTESSGVAPSGHSTASWWTHNDSGNPAELYHFDLDGQVLGRHPVPGVENRDWEDIAAGPCPGTDEPCLYVAEIGDNKKRYPWVAVYAVREPSADAADDQPAAVVATWRARYPRGARNAEALLRDPLTGLLYLVTKDGSGLCEVYRFPATPSENPGLLTQVASVQLEGDSESMRKATGGDWSADGRRVVLRTYQVAWEWDVHTDDREAHWSDTPRRAWLSVEEQGEAVSYTPDYGLITTSEGQPMPVNAVPRPGQATPR